MALVYSVKKNIKKYSLVNTVIMRRDFCEWLVGIEEDDPKPYEVNKFIFYVTKNGKVLNVSIMGSDVNTSDFERFCFYYPLEAQFFNSRTIMNFPYNASVGRTLIFLMSIKYLVTFKNLYNLPLSFIFSNKQF